MNSLQGYLRAKARPHLLLAIVALLLVASCQKDAPQSNDTASAGAGKQIPTVVFGINPDYPPMELVDPRSGVIVGYSIDLINAVGERGGFKPVMKPVDWKAIFGTLDAGDIDAILSSVTITEERKKKYDFSDSYYQISQRMVIRAADADKLKSIDDFKSRRVGVEIGTTGAILMEQLFPHIERVNYDSSNLGFADLSGGKIDGFMVDEPVAVQYSKANPATSGTYDMIDFRFSEENYGIAVRKGDKELLDKINAGLRAVKEEGLDRQIEAKWLH